MNKAYRINPADKIQSPANLLSTQDAAALLGVSAATLRQWRKRELFGCRFFTPDYKYGNTCYYERERVEQLKAVYQPGVLQNMYKLARLNPDPDDFDDQSEDTLSDDFQKSVTTLRHFAKGHRGYYSTEQVAEFFDVDYRTIQRWIEDGTLRWERYDHHDRGLFRRENIIACARRRESKKNLSCTDRRTPHDSDSDKKIAPTEADGAKLISSNKPMEDCTMNQEKSQQERISAAEQSPADKPKGINLAAHGWDLVKAANPDFEFKESPATPPTSESTSTTDTASEPTATTNASTAQCTLIENLPPDLAKQFRFISARINDKGDKEPILDMYPGKKKGRSWTNPKNQSTADDALHSAKVYYRGSNIPLFAAFDISGHDVREDYALIDFDHVLDADGNFIYPDAKKWFDFIQQKLGGYCELSQSGTGIHFLCLPTPGKFDVIKNSRKGNGILTFDESTGAKIELSYRMPSKLCHMTGTLFHCEKGAAIPTGNVVDEVITALLDAIKEQSPEIVYKAYRGKSLTAAERRTKLSPDLQALVDKINSIPLAELVAHGYLTHSENGGAPPNGFVCPWCGSGTHANKSGALTYYEVPADGHFHCHANQCHGDVIALLAQNYAMPMDGKSFFAVLRRAADEFEIEYDTKTLERPARAAGKAKAESDAFDALTDDVREAVTQWQSAHSDLSHIAPEMLSDIGDAASYVDALTAATFTADDALNPATFRKIAVLNVFIKTRAEKYFVTLKTAQETAKSMLKPDAAEFAEPTDDTRILANLRPSDMRNDIEKLTRKVIDEQKSYARQRTLEIEAERERERDERYLESEWTTQKVVADCPINLVIPLKVAFSMMADVVAGGTDIYIGTVTGGEKPRAFVGARTLAVPTKRLRDPAGNEAFEIAIRDEKGNWHRVEVDGRTLSDSRKILELAGKGLRVEDPSHTVKYFQRMLAANPTVIPTIRAYSQPGWYGDKFIYPVGGTDYLVRRAGFDYGAMFATRGDAEPWKNIFIRACERGGAVARIFIGTALAAALVKPLNLDNLQMHVDGTAGCGKTRLNKLAASIFGNPRRLLRTFNATRKNMLAAAAANNDLPQFYDELETVKRQRAGESIVDIVYEYSEHVGNQANKRDGTAREPFYFRGARVSTAERPILQQRDQRGAWRRLVQIRADEKIFDSDFAAELDAVVANNFGHHGRKWYEFVETHLPAIKAAHSELVAMFKNNYKRPTEPQLFNSVIAAGFAYQCFMRCIDERSDLDNLWVDATEDIETILKKLPTPSELDDTTRALNDLKSFVAAHEACFYHGQANQSDKPPFTANFARAEYYGKIFTNGEVAFFPTALRKILETELGYPSSDALIAEWRNKLLLKTSDGKGNRYVSWINGKSINTYRFRAEILFYKDSDSDDEQANS